MRPSPILADHPRSARETTMATTAAATTIPASHASRPASPAGRVSSMIDRNISGGTSASREPAMMAIRNPISWAR